ncbi:MAG: PHP domain-containing protein [Sulfolobaceae archaeon]|nr:PHP domain-containing protein [Sulfolobaceae archaeon]
MSCDFHVHTYYSDGRESPNVMVQYAKKNGINRIAITDHDTTEGIKNVDYPVIPGMEVTTQFGHVVIICNHPPKELSRKPVESVIDYAKENDCIAFPSHPFDIFREGLGDHIFEYKFDAIEVYNPRAPKSANKKALDAAKKMNLVELSNSDSHIKETLGLAYNIIDVSEDANVDDILSAIKKNKIIENVKLPIPFMVKLKILEWGILRRIEKNTRRTMYEVQRN